MSKTLQPQVGYVDFGECTLCHKRATQYSAAGRDGGAKLAEPRCDDHATKGESIA